MMCSYSSREVNQLHKVIAAPTDLLDRWNEAFHAPQRTTQFHDRLFADHSLLGVGAAKATPGARDIVLDIGGSYTKFVIRTVSEDGKSVTWSEPQRIPNKSIEQMAKAENEDFWFDGYAKVVMRQIVDQLGDDALNASGMAVIWSNRMDPYSLESSADQELIGVGGIVPEDCEFSKKEFFTLDGKLQGKDLTKILLGAAKNAGMEKISTFAISNDTVFTANSISSTQNDLGEFIQSVGGLIASSGTNITMMIESLLRNAEAGVGLHVPKEFLTDAEIFFVDNFNTISSKLKHLGLQRFFTLFEERYWVEDRPEVAGLRSQDLTGGNFIAGWFAVNLANQLGLLQNSSTPKVALEHFVEFAKDLDSKKVMDLSQGDPDALSSLHLSKDQEEQILTLADAFGTRTTTLIALLMFISGKDAYSQRNENVQAVVAQDSQVLRHREELQELLNSIVSHASDGYLAPFPVQELQVGNQTVSVPSLGAANTLDIIRAAA